MRKWFVIFGFLLLVPFAYGQRKTCNGRLFDGITFQPLIGASVYNMNTQKFAFTDKNGQFSIMVSLNDTLVISKSIYRQLVVTVNDKIYSGLEDFFLYYKATMLKEVTIFAINPSYEGFKKDIVTLELPDYYKRVEETKLSEMQKANAVYKPNGNIQFSRKSKMNRLYQEMLSYDDEVERIQDKYNREIVSELTGLKGDELLQFMMYCRFNYYDLVRMSDEDIKAKIKAKFYDYEYYKAVNSN